jgi:hypothetical protein
LCILVKVHHTLCFIDKTEVDSMFAYQRIVPSLYIAVFLFMLFGCTSSIQESDKLTNATKDVSQPQHLTSQINRLKSFLSLYCQTYESKNFDKFAALFTPDALENNRPFYLLLPKYRKNMDMAESFTYRIDLLEYSSRTPTGNIMFKGKYFTRFVYEGTLKENSGNISMELVENGDLYLVKQLNYTAQP